MKIEIENNVPILTEVFSGLILRTPSGEELSICMRDSGFEFNYQGQPYRAQEGEIAEVTPKKFREWISADNGGQVVRKWITADNGQVVGQNVYIQGKYPVEPTMSVEGIRKDSHNG